MVDGNHVPSAGPVQTLIGTRFIYDGLNRVVSEESPTCTAPTVNFYDAVNKTASRAPDGRMTHFAYDDRHRLISKTWVALGSQNDAGARTLTYDLAGNLKSVTDP